MQKQRLSINLLATHLPFSQKHLQTADLDTHPVLSLQPDRMRHCMHWRMYGRWCHIRVDMSQGRCRLQQHTKA